MTDPDHVAAEMGELVQDTSPGELDRFYDRLRRRIRESVERRGGRVGEKASEALLVVPDVFMLMMRLTMDRKVPEQARAVIGGALAYFILPADLFPEMVLGAPGYIDDVVVAAIVLTQTFGPELTPYIDRHWSGSQKLSTVLQDIAEAGQGLLGESLYSRVQRLLSRRGIKTTPASGS